MPMTISARRMASTALRPSSGKDHSSIRSPSRASDTQLPGVLLQGVLEQLEELRDRREDPVPVRDKRYTTRILDQFRSRRAQAPGEDADGYLLCVAIEAEAVQHGVGVISRDCVLGHPDVAHLQAAKMIAGEHETLRSERREQRLSDIGRHPRQSLVG